MNFLYSVTGDKYKIDGIWRAKVIDDKDPYKQGRIKVRVYPLMDSIKDEDLPWAEPCWMGFCYIPPKESWVWVMFQEGDVHRPVWLGFSTPFDENGIVYKKGALGEEFAKQNFDAEGMFNEVCAQYPGSVVYLDKFGNWFVFYDDKRILLKNAENAYVLLLEDGSIVLHGEKILLDGVLHVKQTVGGCCKGCTPPCIGQTSHPKPGE